MTEEEKRDAPIELGELNAADFESHLGSEFIVDVNRFGRQPDGSLVERNDVYPSDTVITLKLVEVNRKDPPSAYTRQDPFGLLFCGSHDQPLYAESHLLIHESLGRIALFLSPVNAFPGILPEQHPDGRFYESIVN